MKWFGALLHASRVLYLASGLLGLLAAVLVIYQLPRFADAARWNSDAAAPSVLVDSLASGGLAEDPTVLGEISSYSTILLFRATHWLPHHHAVWGAIPYTVTLIGILFMVLGVRRVSGWGAGMVTGALGTATSLDVLFTQVAPAFHGTTWLTVGLLSFTLVWLAAPERRAGVKMWVVTLGLGVVVGLNLVSDPLLLIVGVVPFLVAAALTRRRGRLDGKTSRLVHATWLTAGVGLAVALIVDLGMRASDKMTSRRVRGDGYVELANPHELASHLQQLWRNLLGLFGVARGESLPRHWYGYLVLLAGLLGIVALGYAYVRALSRTPLAPEWRAHCAFWATSAMLLVGAYVVSGIPDASVTDTTTVRYLVPLVLAVAAVAPVWAARHPRRQVLVGFGSVLIVALGVSGIASGELADIREASPLARQAPRIEAWLTEHRTRTGYGGYWSALALTSQTRLVVRAVEQCGTDRTPTLCPRRINTRRGWYRPTRAARTFILVDTRRREEPTPAIIANAPDLGAPSETGEFNGFTVFVYDYDVGTRIGEWPTR